MAALYTDFPERFQDRRQLWGLAENGSRRELQLEEHWFHKGGVVLKFAGVESIGDAEQLVRMELQIPVDQRAELEAGAAFVSELVGCEVWVANEGESRLLGTIKDLQFGAGEAPLLVIESKAGDGQKEVLVPYAEEFLKASDLAGRRIEMQLPEGLLELQDPLTDEEKQRQNTESSEARAAGERSKRKK